MPLSVIEIPRYLRRQLKRIVQRSWDRDHSRRALAILHLYEAGGCVSEAARRVCAARSSVQRWRERFEDYGVQGLAPARRGRMDYKADDKVLKRLNKLLATTPRQRGYLRSRWSSELLAKELARDGGVHVHATTIRRWLKRLAYVWRRARPTLHIRDPRKSERMRAVNRALRLGENDPGTEVFYSDEADIDLNPRIGSDWMPRGQQLTVPTPGKNRKRYLAGALNARTGHVVWGEHERKDSSLFVHLLHKLNRSYRRARRIILIVDNFVIHKSRVTQSWLARHPRFKLVFQPTYSPWVNHIEKLWKQLHDTVTRNHRHNTLKQLMRDVRTFMKVASPFPGAGHALAPAK